MAKTVNLIRYANAILKKGTIAGYGYHWAFNDKADGFNVVDVTVPNIPLNVKQYLEGDEDLKIYGVGTDVSKLCAYSLASFPKLEKVYLLNYTDMITLETNWDATLVYLNEIYVPESLLSRYQTEYPNETRFKILVEQATLEIPYIGTDDLTTEYVDTIMAGLLESSLPLITRVVIDSRFTEASADYIAWNYDFSVLTNLNEVLYGTTKYDFSVLTISGSGALTSAIVEANILEVPSSKRSAITKVVVSSGLTLNTSASAGCLDICDTYLPNVTTLELNQPINRQDTGIKPYTNISNSNNKFVNIIWNYTSITSKQFNSSYIKYFESNTITTIPYESCFESSKLEDIKVPNVTEINYRAFAKTMLGYNGTYILFEKVELLRLGYMFLNAPISKLFLPKINKIENNGLDGLYRKKVFMSTNNCELLGALGGNYWKIYFKAIDLTTYKVATNWSSYANDMIGIIDGGSTYTNIKNRGVSMEYPTLTGIDTEANIQLLTPSDNSLYLASDTGNLWQYDSGAWTNLFSGYTPSWYSNEDVTTVVLPSAMDTSHTYYVKLTAI